MANLSGQNIGSNFKGMLNLGSTINTPLSTTLQAITDGDGVASPLQLATNRIALGASTGTSLLNFPDAGTTSADGISFGTGLSIFRDGDNQLVISPGLKIPNSGYLQLKTGASSTFQVNQNSLNLTPVSLTGSSATSALSITQTWNTTGNPTAIFANITNTASGASANLMDLQIGGNSVYKFKANGTLDFLLGAAGVTTTGITFGNNIDKGIFVTGGNTNTTIYQQFTGHRFNVYNGSVYTGQKMLINNTGVYVGTGTIKSSSALEVESTTQGFLTPRMTTAQKLAIASPAEGLEVYDLTLHQKSYYNGTVWVNY